MKAKQLIALCVAGFVIVFSGNVFAVILFQDNFDSQSDWTVAQPTSGANACYSTGCNVPTGWNAYYSQMSFCSGAPGNNNFYLGSANARGGSGKAMTFYDESCVDSFEDSDGNLGIKLGTVYPELYIRFYIKFQPGYQWTTNPDAPQHKFLHIQYHCNSGNPWSYFGNDCNKPSAVGNFHAYGGHIWYSSNFRCEENYYCQGSPKYNFDVTGDMDHVDLGSLTSVLGDGNWHSVEYRFKMNTNNGATFNADGVHQFWLDGVKRMSRTAIPWSDSGSTQSPRRGWNFVSIGGNNNNRWTRSCSGTSCEQWYAIDDVVISTEYIGPGPAPTIPSPSNLSVLPPAGN